jgi:hypothetical protein
MKICIQKLSNCQYEEEQNEVDENYQRCMNEEEKEGGEGRKGDQRRGR